MNNYFVYMHIAPNGKRYVGITKQKPIKRWKNGYGYTNSPHFYNAILKYGWDNFQHIILAENLSLNDACEMEKTLIKQYDLTNREFGYNECLGGEGTNGYRHSDDTKQRLRESTLASLDSGQREQISVAVKKRWQEGAYVNRKYNQIPWNKGHTKDDDPRIAKYCRKVGEFHHTKETKDKMSKSHTGKPAKNRKKVLCIETKVLYNSAMDATKITGTNNISIAARDQNRTAGGFHWRYINDNI